MQEIRINAGIRQIRGGRCNRLKWFENHANRRAGDFNSDGIFDTSDLTFVFQAGEYEDDIVGNSTFEEGDWNGDGDFTTADLVAIFVLGEFQNTPA
jgi:hypothetical protein